MAKGERTKLLLVEDDEIDRLAFERLVRSEGLSYDYNMTASVAEALRMLESERFDIILLDLQLGDGTAFEIIPSIIDTPFVVVTGCGDESVAVRAMKLGAHDYLIKDHERNYLTMLPVTVEGAINRHRTERKLHDREMYIQSVHATVPEVIVTVNEEGVIESVNPAVAKVFGYEEDELIGRNIELLIPPSFLTDDSSVCDYLRKERIRFIGAGYESFGWSRSSRRVCRERGMA